MKYDEYVIKIHERNKYMEENKFRKSEDTIITSNEIYTILSAYRIGKKPLAKLLGWGETTIIRYIDGDIPTNEYSDKLWAILDNPVYYLDILNQSKDKLTGVAYKKSKKAVMGRIMESRLNVVAQYIINYTEGEISATSVQAILYYAQGFSLAMLNKELFKEEYVVTNESHPYPKIYKEMKKRGIHCFDIGEDLFTVQEKDLINCMIEVFNWYGPKALSTILAYEKIALRISRDANNNKVITKDTLKSYFKDIIEQYNITQLSEVVNYPEQRLSQIKALIG